MTSLRPPKRGKSSGRIESKRPLPNGNLLVGISGTAMPCINAVSFHADPSIESICRRVLVAGFDTIEVSRPAFFDGLRTAETRARFVDWSREQGLGLRGFDCWVDVLPFDGLAPTRAGFRAAIEFAKELGLGSIITHDAWLRDTKDSSPRASLLQHLELFAPIVEDCQQAGLELLFEPHPDTLSMENSWCIDFIDGLKSPIVGVVYDCCHYGVGQPQTYSDAIEVLGSRIRHLHYSDGDRKTYALHLPVGDGDLDLAAICARLKAISYRGTLTNDLYSYPLLDDGARRNAPRIREVEEVLGIGAAGLS